MAKNKYLSQVAPYLKEIKQMSEDGLTLEQMAINLKISDRSFRKYLDEEEDLREAVHSGRTFAITEIENAMFRSALGYTETLKKGMKVKKVKYANGSKEAEVEVVEPYEEQIHIKPDTQAGIFLLKNWAKDKYSSDPQLLELKKRDQDLKEKIAEQELDDDDNPFA